jgi:hypothetical protein
LAEASEAVPPIKRVAAIMTIAVRGRAAAPNIDFPYRSISNRPSDSIATYVASGPPSHFDAATVEGAIRRKLGKQIVAIEDEISCDR